MSQLRRGSPHGVPRDVYINGLGAFFPGEPVSNGDMEAYLGKIGGVESRLRERVLARNGIVQRHYAIDRNQRTLFKNSEMAAHAVRRAVERAGCCVDDVGFLAAATTQGDLLVPGFASEVHGEIGGSACEIASLHGVCASSVAALRAAQLQVAVGERDLAVACASELPSRLFKASRYERQGAGVERPLDFDTEFLRWMLSDGAGAAVVASEPSAAGPSLRIDWIELQSHAHRFPACMYAGADRPADGGASWLDYPSFEAAASAGALNLKQDVSQLDDVVALGVESVRELVGRGRLDLGDIDWLACHYSSDYFRERIQRGLGEVGLAVPEEKWFSNLATRGNVGSASLFVLLEELVYQKHARPGQRILAVVPESGRYVMAFVHLTVMDPTSSSHLGPRRAPRHVGEMLRDLAAVREDFEARLLGVPLIARLESGRFTRDDYRALLSGLRQQVVDGARWITRAASNLDARDPVLAELRSIVIRHAADEHRDYEMLERDFVSVGGDLDVIRSGEKNVGSEALSAFVLERASRPNPLSLLGVMFVIEGLGSRMGRRFGRQIMEQLGLEASQVSFLLYHGEHDDDHLGKLGAMLASDAIDATVAREIVKAARVTARLYALQLEEIDA